MARAITHRKLSNKLIQLLDIQWQNRDPINEVGLMLMREAIESDWEEELNLYAFVANNPVTQWDYVGLAYFAYRPLDGLLGWGGAIGGSIDDKLNTVIGHEQLFFEDGKSPSNIGFVSDGTLQAESDTIKYRSAHHYGYDDCIMRQAVANVALKDYCLLGKSGDTDKSNCQDWAEAVREEYRRLAK